MPSRWLKQIWTCKSSNNELKESVAVKLAKKFLNNTLSNDDAKIVVQVRTHNGQET